MPYVQIFYIKMQLSRNMDPESANQRESLCPLTIWVVILQTSLPVLIIVICYLFIFPG